MHYISLANDLLHPTHHPLATSSPSIHNISHTIHCILLFSLQRRPRLTPSNQTRALPPTNGTSAVATQRCSQASPSAEPQLHIAVSQLCVAVSVSAESWRSCYLADSAQGRVLKRATESHACVGPHALWVRTPCTAVWMWSNSVKLASYFK